MKERLLTREQLAVGDGIDLPIDLVTHRNALLGMSGAGKSNAAVVLAEEMHRARVPWIVVDPKDDWFGIRSSRDGKGAGLDVPVLGGEHGDLPLSPHAGARLAELVAAGKLTGIFDVSGFESNADVSRFLADFGRVLLAQNRTPIHVFCDECDEYLPQPGAGGRLDGPAAKCVSVWKKLAKQGRFRGIGFTLISQRSALVNKTALYMCETLIAMRTVGVRDKRAIGEWVDNLGDSKALLASLPRLEDGEAWLWSPQRLRMEKRFRFRRRATFDSGRTPEVGEALVVPTLARLDIEALRTELAGLAEGDDADAGADATALRRELAAVRAELEQARQAAQEPALRARDIEAIAELVRLCNALRAALEPLLETAGEAQRATSSQIRPDVGRKALGPSFRPLPTGRALLEHWRQRLPAGERAILDVLAAAHPKAVDRETLSARTGYRRSSRDTYLQRLGARRLVVAADGGVRAAEELFDA